VTRVILVADDNPLMRQAFCKLFATEEGLELCEQAVNGQDAIDKAKRCRPDLIIMDFSMPLMNGIDAARIIKKLMPSVPIILFSVHPFEMLSESAREAGIDILVPKTEMATLVEHARKLLGASGRSSPGLASSV
jgi:DNA-binding NarL/FixJ family response regulator